MTAHLVAILIVAGIYTLLSLGLVLQYGLTGLINFGTVGFFAIGAYASALLSLEGVPIPLGFVAAGVLAGVAAWPIGLVALRLREDYFAIVTLGFSEVVRVVLTSERWLTKGVQGLPGIPRLFEGWGAWGGWATLGSVAAACLLATGLILRMARSPFGRVIQAIRDNEEAVAALGKEPAGFKVRVLVVGAGLAGVAGAFYAHYITFIVPEQFIPLVTFYAWMAVIMGGATRPAGALLGSLLLLGFLEGTRFLRDVVPAVGAVDMASLRIGAVGVLLIVFVLFRPQGILGR